MAISGVSPILLFQYLCDAFVQCWQEAQLPQILRASAVIAPFSVIEGTNRKPAFDRGASL